MQLMTIKLKQREHFSIPDDSEEVLENPQEVLAKITNLCDSLINGQENCVSWIKSEDNVNSQTEELVETFEGLQSELRIYKDLLMEDTGHAPAMKSIVDSMRPDIERMSNESYGMTYDGILPKHGEQIARCLGGQWETMGELCDQLDRLGSIQTTSQQAEPAAASQAMQKQTPRRQWRYSMFSLPQKTRTSKILQGKPMGYCGPTKIAVTPRIILVILRAWTM